MFKTLFEDNGLLGLPMVVLLFFFAFFVAVVCQVYVVRRATHFQQAANLPFDGDAESGES